MAERLRPVPGYKPKWNDDPDNYGLRSPEPHPQTLIPPPHLDDHADMAKLEMAIQNNKNATPLDDIAIIVKGLTFGEMVVLVKEMKSVSETLSEQAIWDWACKRIDKGFDKLEPVQVKSISTQVKTTED